ncbi:MAG: hypothetical protein IJJ47_01930 [Methanosphaera sp.]|nr:hypothetical protein [Methanosphaera sp.]
MQDSQKELLQDYKIEIRTYQDVIVEDIPGFLKKIDIITQEKENSIIQLLDSDYICGKKHLRQGISQAFKAFNEKQNFAKDKGLEICVRLSAQKQISQALKILGIKKQGNITVVYVDTTQEQIKLVENLLKTRNDSLLEQYDEEKIIKAYNLISSNNIVDEINEKIALLSLKN